MRNIAASSSWNALAKDGESFTMQLELGTPYQVDGSELSEWACPVSLTPMFGQLADMHGTDAIQSMTLAMGLARSLLQQFLHEGGQLLAEDGSVLTLKEILPCISDFQHT